MTPTDQEQKAAIEWLDHAIRKLEGLGHAFPGDQPRPHIATLKAMLAEPRMPKNWSADELRALMRRIPKRDFPFLSEQDVVAILQIAHTHLSEPTAGAAQPPSNGLPLHIEIDQTAPGTNAVLERCVEALVRAGMVTVGGSIGARIMERIKPKKLKPVFHCEGTHNPRHISASTVVTADWHDVNQAISALSNDGYTVVVVRREMVPE